MYTSTQPSTYFFHLSSLSPLRHIRVSHCRSLVQGPTSQPNTCTWIEIQPKSTHLPNYLLTFFICHPYHPCTLIRVSLTISWCKAKQTNQTIAPELNSDPNAHIYPTIPLHFWFVIPVTLAPPLGSCTFKFIQTLRPELKHDQTIHIYSTIYFFFPFVISINLAPALGFIPQNPGARPNRSHKYLHMNWNMSQTFTSNHSQIYKASCAKLHLLRISVTHAPLPINHTLDGHHILQPSRNLFPHTPRIHPHPFILSHFLCHPPITLAPATFPNLRHLKIPRPILIKTLTFLHSTGTPTRHTQPSIYIFNSSSRSSLHRRSLLDFPLGASSYQSGTALALNWNLSIHPTSICSRNLARPRHLPHPPGSIHADWPSASDLSLRGWSLYTL